MSDAATIGTAPGPSSASDAVAIDLTAVIVAVTEEEPRVLAIAQARRCRRVRSNRHHRTLQTGVRSWVERQTHHPLGYVEQLYTFADRDRTGARRARRSRSAISA